VSGAAAKAKAKVNDPAKARGAIRDQGYQRYTGKYTDSGRWALIAKRMLKMSARQPWVLVMLILCIFPGLVGAVIMYIQAKMFAMTNGAGPPPDPTVLYLFLKPYGTLMIGFLTALFAGGGAVADDAKGGAFQFYFARPVTRDQYFIGKLLPPVLLTFFVTAGPAFLVAILRVALAKDSDEAIGSALLPLKALGMGVIEALALGIPVVALSSLSRGRGYVQGAFAALFLLPWILGSIFVGVTRSPWPAILSLPAHFNSIGLWLFRVPIEDAERVLPVWVSAGVLVVLVGASIAILRKRLDAVEVIAG
jgi:ABC-type transport system involved in multi-copper enzyme maturation permease subunit